VPPFALSPSPSPGPLAVDQAQVLFRVLAEPIRLRMVQALASGERCVCDLTAELELAQPKLSFHLKVMKEAGLITARQQGRWVYYRLRPEVLLALRDWLNGLAASCDLPALECP
jgi:ArsR family transcriptional regulator